MLAGLGLLASIPIHLTDNIKFIHLGLLGFMAPLPAVPPIALVLSVSNSPCSDPKITRLCVGFDMAWNGFEMGLIWV